MCLAQGHNVMMSVRLKLQPLGLESSNLPLRSLDDDGGDDDDDENDDDDNVNDVIMIMMITAIAPIIQNEKCNYIQGESPNVEIVFLFKGKNSLPLGANSFL